MSSSLASPHSPFRKWRLKLRPTLLGAIIGLLVATVATIGGVAFFQTSRSIDLLVDQHFDTAANAAATEVRRLLAPAPAILRELEILALRGRLPLQDMEALGEIFAERLRQQPDLAWIVYGDATRDTYTGATRADDGSIVFKRSTPAVENARPVAEVINPDGSRGKREIDADPYTLWSRSWFTEGMKAEGIHWTKPYQFRDGQMGITATLRLKPPGDAEPLGVFTTDFFLGHVDEFLSRLVVSRRGRAYLIAQDGTVVARSHAPGGETVDAAAATAIREADTILPTLAPGGAPRRRHFAHDGVTYRSSLHRIADEGNLGWAVLVLAPESDFTAVIEENARATLAIGLAAFALAAILATLFANRISVPLRTISGDLEAVGRLAITDAPAPRSVIREIAVMGDAVDRMKAGLRSFERYIPVDVVRELLRSGREAALGGEQRELTIHFSDIAGFTSIAEGMAPNAIVAELGEYFDTMTLVLQQHRATVDKFMGDGILAFFNAPLPVPDHPVLACRAALEAQIRLTEMRARREAEGRPVFRARIGLELGEVLVGNIGTKERFAYTVIGDAVNLASRLEGLNKFYSTSIIGTERLRAATGEEFEWRRLDRVAVVGRHEGTLISELLGARGRLPAGLAEARDLYEAALAAYLARDFERAAAGFQAALAARPGDAASAAMLRRARKLRRSPPPADWTGIYVQTQK